MTTFVALDLETTGLDPNMDTIIEIAAIRFELERDASGWVIKNPIERTMLVDPGIPLQEEVTLITGITPAMLEWRSRWEDIRENVDDFIGSDTILLGHNVFFDIAMLKTHGISLEAHQICDTFELAELFSGSAESLNLGFLADHYSIKKRGEEHRALTDTWLATDLFVHYLHHIDSLSEGEQYIWGMIRRHLPKDFAFYTNLHNTIDKIVPQDTRNTAISEITLPKKSQNHTENTPWDKFELVSLSGLPNEEWDLIASSLATHGKIEIITENYTIAKNIKNIFDKGDYTALIHKNPSDFIALDIVWERLEDDKHPLDRKELILLMRLAFWGRNTTTGLIDELKLYGEERKKIELYRYDGHGDNDFFNKYQQEKEASDILLTPLSQALPELKRFPLYKDIPLLEGAIRKQLSEEVDFWELREFIDRVEHPKNNDLIDALNWLEALYTSLPERPEGVSAFPPGKYGETYFLTQQEIWQKGCKWWALTTHKWMQTFVLWKGSLPKKLSRDVRFYVEKIERWFFLLLDFFHTEFPHMGAIFTITPAYTKIRFIAQNLSNITEHWWKRGIGYGYGIHTPPLHKFICSAFPFSEDPQLQTYSEHTIPLQFSPSWPSQPLSGRTLILTTSSKHIRELWAQYIRPILQWTSWGKAKMCHYYLQNPESILIGLIDTWCDMSDIFSETNHIIIARVPFDPPTDPYFLAKTRGMKNNFEEYSKPIVLSKLNTLIGRIITANPSATISFQDERLMTTEWGKFLRAHFI